MADLKAVAQQALEFVTSEQWGTVPYMDGNVYSDAQELEDALRAALAQAEPVQSAAWVDAYDMIDRFLRNNLQDDDYAEYSAALDSLYTAPQQAEPVQRKPATGAAPCLPSLFFQMNAQAEPPCDHCQSPLFCATSCRVCGRKNEQAHGIKGKA